MRICFFLVGSISQSSRAIVPLKQPWLFRRRLFGVFLCLNWKILCKHFNKEVFSSRNVVYEVNYQESYISIDELKSVKIFKRHVLILLFLDVFHIKSEVFIKHLWVLLILFLIVSVGYNRSIHSENFTLLNIVIECIVLSNQCWSCSAVRSSQAIFKSCRQVQLLRICLRSSTILFLALSIVVVTVGWLAKTSHVIMKDVVKEVFIVMIP